jgi:hypothetical protein
VSADVELTEKLADARGELRDAEALRERIAFALVLDADPDVPPVPVRLRDRLTVELHTADLRVQLWRDVVAEVERRLKAAE